MTEYQRGLEAAAKFLESQINDYARPISLQAWAAAIRGLTPQEVCPTCGSAKKGVFDASAPNLNKHCWAKGWHDPWHDRGITPQPERGDPTIGRTIDEERRPLVCFVCGKRFGITFNFCLEHKDEYEKLKREDSVEVPQPATWIREAAVDFVAQMWAAIDMQDAFFRTKDAYVEALVRTFSRHFAAPATPPTPQPELEKLVAAVQEFLKHDGGPGSENYDASKIYQARRAMQSAFGFRCPRCGETLPHLYDENCTDYRRAGVPVEPTPTQKSENCRDCRGPVTGSVHVELVSGAKMCFRCFKNLEAPATCSDCEFESSVAASHDHSLAGVEQPTPKEAK